MSQPNPRERLRTATGATLANIAAVQARRRAQGERVQPGDLFVLPQTREQPVEWLVLRLEAERALVIAADTHPAVGSHDVAVPASAASGPLYLRCGLGAWIATAELDGELRTGTVEEIYLGYAHRKRRELETAAASDSWAERQTDGELAYRDWCRDVLDEALRRLGGSAAPARATARFGSRRRAGLPWLIPAAAAAVFACLALSTQILRLREQNQALLRPSINPPVFYVAALDPTRSGPSMGEIPLSATQAIVFLDLPTELGYSTYRVEILDDRGASVWRSPDAALRNSVELVLTVPTASLRDGFYQLRIEGRNGDRFETVSERTLQIRFTKP